MTITELCKAAHDNAVAKGFYGNDGKGERNIGELLMLIVSELGEVIEADRKGWWLTPRPIVTQKPEYEEWKDIEGFNGEYQVSNWGRVKSVNIRVWNGKIYYTKPEKILTPGLGGTGYYTVALRSKSYKVARLVAGAFIQPYNGEVVNHLDGNKTHDYATNLEWTTFSGNSIHANNTGLVSHERKLTQNERIDIAFRFKNGETAPSIWNDYKEKVSLSAIKNIRQSGYQSITESVEFEMADAIIRIADMAGYLGVDLDAHICAKMAYNATREKLHGKKY